MYKRTRAGEDALSASNLNVNRENGTLELRGIREVRNPVSGGPQVSMDLDIFVPTTDSQTVEHNRVETGLGDINVSNTAGYPELVTDLRDIRTTGVTGFTGIEGDGDVELTLRSIERQKDPVNVDSGNLTLRLTSDLDCVFDLSVDSGEIVNHGVPLTNVSQGEESLSGQLGEGENTLTGSVRAEIFTCIRSTNHSETAIFSIIA
ncbi:hypothetical protein SAMN04487948_11617 [Halogranum amylolyticum]|uniref:Adhesin domain-containing protein n=1 Tax=Halogranum amylolyticum TaxID=660520 RepID=A0A1H8VE96_9EURY|nr:hypothetical protein [Halogranum amylolyticum]SEP13709.1 hypothetical protein SAMN04487948_11617 [Halogranum amylolyticum]